MSDSLEIESLFERTNMASDEGTYEKIEWLELSDQQGQNYAGGHITWNTQSITTHPIVYSESYLQLPIKVTFEGDPAATPSTSKFGRIAVKNSVLSLIHGITIESGAGTQIVGETLAPAILNNLKLLLDSSIDFVEGNELHYCGKDTSPNNSNLAGEDKSMVGCVKSTISDAVPGIDPYKNQGLADRITIFSNRATTKAIVAGKDCQYFVAMIPLKFIHDFFKQLDFPIMNLSLKIRMDIAGCGNYADYKPFTCPEFTGHYSIGPSSTPAAPTGADGAAKAADLAAKSFVAAPVVAIPQIQKIEVVPNFTSVDGAIYSPQLMLKKVFFRAQEAQALANKIEKGFTKRIVYTTATHYHSHQAGGGNQVKFSVVQGVIRPVRMWVLPLVTDTLIKADNVFPAAIGEYILKDTNITLNGINFYQNPFKNPYEYYKEFKTQCIGASVSTTCGSPISYDDWIKGINPYVFDLSRNPTVKSNSQCNLVLNTKVGTMSSPNAAPAFDLEAIVERLLTVDLQVSSGGVIALVHNGVLD